jgi:hypothetical protein
MVRERVIGVHDHRLRRAIPARRRFSANAPRLPANAEARQTIGMGGLSR